LVFQDAWLPGTLEVRGEDVADVDAEFLGVPCQFDTLLGGVGAGHHLNESPRLDPARLLHRDPNDLLELVGGQRPELGDAAGEPDPVLIQIDQAVSHHGSQCLEVDVVAVRAGKRRVERAAVTPQMLDRPLLGLLAGHTCGHYALLR